MCSNDDIVLDSIVNINGKAYVKLFERKKNLHFELL
jgi:hypothetical protein